MFAEGSQPELRVTEIFRSIQGESTHAGFPCAFVRLTGCSLRCVWCDTAYAFHGGSAITVEETVTRVLALDTDLVEVTGGEPLEQEAVYPLMDRLLGSGKTVLLETGGHVPLDRVDPRVFKIIDVKAPGSGMESANLPQNLDRLSASRWSRPQPHVARPRQLRFLEVGGQSLREPSEHFNGCAERLFQIEGNLCFKQESVVEPIEAVLPPWAKHLELHQILQVFRIDTEDRARLFQFQFDWLLQDYTIYIQME